MPSSKSAYRTGNITVWISTVCPPIRQRRPSSESAFAPDGLPIRMSASSVNGSNPVTSTLRTPPENRLLVIPREVYSRDLISAARPVSDRPNRGVHWRNAFAIEIRAQYSPRSSVAGSSPGLGVRFVRATAADQSASPCARTATSATCRFGSLHSSLVNTATLRSRPVPRRICAETGSPPAAVVRGSRCSSTVIGRVGSEQPV